jgi:hypothetical protein
LDELAVQYLGTILKGTVVVDIRLPIPRNWQDFEVLCFQLWKDIWADPNAQRNGRQGQPQNGVDIWGMPAHQSTYSGVQCKDKDSRLGKELSADELDAECKNARNFTPTIRSFSMATTAPRDAKLQEHSRLLNDRRAYPFTVHVWSWDDIEEEVRFRPTLIETYYPDLKISPDNAARIVLSPASHTDHFHAFFSRPEVRRRIPTGLREFLVPICYELSDNAYIHGKASQVTIKCDDQKVVLQDNGVAFDPIKNLDAEKVSSKSHVGSFVVASFCREFANVLDVRYERLSTKDKTLNTVIIESREPFTDIDFAQPAELVVDLSRVAGRSAANRMAYSVPLPADSHELVLQITEIKNPSALVEFISAVLERLPANRRLIVYLPSFGLLRPIQGWFKDDRLTIRFR